MPKKLVDSDSSHENEMDPQPIYIRDYYKGSGKLKGKSALITGGDSGIGRAVAVHFAREGANVAITFHTSKSDAQKTKELIEKEKVKALIIQADLTKSSDAQKTIKKTQKAFGSLNILVNNIAYQKPTTEFDKITDEQLDLTFKTNVFSYFYCIRYALPLMQEGDSIINTTSVTGFRGSHHLIDYASTKSAIVGLTKSLSKLLAEKKIRVNAIAPGPIWTPLIPETFDGKNVTEFGKDTPLARVGQPAEVAPAYVYLASKDGSYVTGQTLHINGGEVVG